LLNSRIVALPKILTQMDFTDRKIDLTLRLYVDSANEDYLSARAAYNSCLFHVFFWCAAQACEKYIKALLLLQDRSKQGYSHNLVSLFHDIRQLDQQGVLPEHLDLPESLTV
jgi:HEPN domain-containing protein